MPSVETLGIFRQSLRDVVSRIYEKQIIMYRYTAYGLKINSDIPCPQLTALNNHNNYTPDVHIHVGKVPKSLKNPVAKGVLYEAQPNEFLLRLDEIGAFWVRNGKELIIAPAPSATDDEVRLFLFGSAFGALLHQRGFLVLHASAIETHKKKAALFVGPSGNGKSTIAAAFHKNGHRVLADDICALTLDEKKRPIVAPSFPQIKIWADTAKKMQHETQKLRKVRPQLEKYALPIHKNFCSSPLLVSSIYHLRTHNKDEITITPIEDSQKFRVLLSNTYRARFIDGLAMRGTHFKQASVTASTARILAVTRPSGTFLLEELTTFIEEDLTQ
ncbi:MAG: hypothetical protein D3916_13310 [Candidatus Electrothrix sp. MAN1_4]|nr:hypothetical protein [Candidatus Electrothrix sp. MAN1_4]